jgi:HEAT repeat protein
LILVVLTVVFATLVVLELAAIAGRRAWVEWKHGRRQRLVEAASETLVDALVLGTEVEPPVGRARTYAFRLAALELFSELAGDSRVRLTRLVEDAGVVDHALRTLRRSPRAFARRVAADQLGEFHSRRAVSAFEAGLDDRDAIVRVACARGLLRIPELRRLDRILDVLDRDGLAEPVETAAAFITLAGVNPEALARLHASARSPSVRWYAALVLARMGRADALPTLRDAIAAPNALMVSHAVHGIAAAGGPQAAALLEGLVADADRDAAVRELAGHELARLQAPGGVA